VLERLREHNVTANPMLTKLGPVQVEHLVHLISTEGTSLTEEERLKVLKFLLPKTKKALLQLRELLMRLRPKYD